MLRDHIVLAHCAEDEVENNYQTVLVEHSLKSLIHQEHETQPDLNRTLRSGKNISSKATTGSKRKSQDTQIEYPTLLNKMNEKLHEIKVIGVQDENARF